MIGAHGGALANLILSVGTCNVSVFEFVGDTVSDIYTLTHPGERRRGINNNWKTLHYAYMGMNWNWTLGVYDRIVTQHNRYKCMLPQEDFVKYTKSMLGAT